jgi:hypothetical protein
MARPEIAQLVQSGAQMGLGLMQEKRMRDVFQLEEDKFQIEQDAAGAINAVAAGESEFTKKRGAGAQTLSEMRKLASMDPSVRKTQAPVVFQALEEVTGKPLADNVKQFILSGKPEVVGPVMDRILRGYAEDPNQTVDGLTQLLSNPLASAQAIGQISRELGDMANQAALTGPQSNPRRNKFMEQKASIERRIKGYEDVINHPKYAQTKSAETANREIERLRGQLEKMEFAMSADEARTQGIPVRSGTTITESGTGGLAVLQGPESSDGGVGEPGGLKATDERFLRTLAAAPYETEINFQTGEIHFKNRADEIAANAVTAKASRAFANAGGRLTLSEAYQEVIKNSGGTPAGGGATPPGKNHFSKYDSPGM